MEFIQCLINGEKANAKVIENMGYQNGHYVKEVLFNGEKYIIIKDGIWRTVEWEEKLRPRGRIIGQ